MSSDLNLSASILRPSQIMVDLIKENPCHALISIFPMEKGFGSTVGNIIRRVLLSSIPGYAVVGCKIPTISNEISNSHYFVEDGISMNLNLRKIICHSSEYSSFFGKIKLLKDRKKYFASDIVFDGYDLNKINIVKGSDTFLFECIGDYENKLEEVVVIFGSGVGYLSSEDRCELCYSLDGVMRIDASFSPVENVNFTVENTSFGGKSDYDKLVIEIKTLFNPAWDVFNFATAILRDYMSTITNISSNISVISDEVSVELRQSEDTSQSSSSTPISSLPMSVRLRKVLGNLGITEIGQIGEITEEKISSQRNCGATTLSELRKIAYDYGVPFFLNPK